MPFLSELTGLGKGAKPMQEEFQQAVQEGSVVKVTLVEPSGALTTTYKAPAEVKATDVVVEVKGQPTQISGEKFITEVKPTLPEYVGPSVQAQAMMAQARAMNLPAMQRGEWTKRGYFFMLFGTEYPFPEWLCQLLDSLRGQPPMQGMGGRSGGSIGDL